MLLHTRGDRHRRCTTGIDDDRDRAHEPAGLAAHRLRRAAQQGDRRPQRVRPRVGHPPGRRAQGALDLRDHGRRGPSGSTRTARAGQALGPRGAAAALEELGYPIDGASLNTAFKRFKEIADKKKQVTALDLEALVTDELREELPGYALEWFDVEASSRRPPHAPRRGPHAGRARSSRARSPATARSTRSSGRSTRRPAIDARLREFRVDAVTGGQDALGEVHVIVELGDPDAAITTGLAGVLEGERVTGAGQAVATDIIEAGGDRLRACAVQRGPPRAGRRRGPGGRARRAPRDSVTAGTRGRGPGRAGPGGRRRGPRRPRADPQHDRRRARRARGAARAGRGARARRPRCASTTSRRCGRTLGTRARRPARDELLELARGAARRRAGAPRLALCGHVDVVDAGTVPWRHGTPWSGALEGGRGLRARQRRHEGRRRRDPPRAGRAARRRGDAGGAAASCSRSPPRRTAVSAPSPPCAPTPATTACVITGADGLRRSSAPRPAR